MLTLFFFITTVVCAIGWLLYWVGSAALAKYILDKGYELPSDDELKVCTVYAWKKLMHIR